MSYLKIENMEIAFNSAKGKFVAVKDIDLEVEKGQIISIIGHSGCGKSTIMNAIGRMVFISLDHEVIFPVFLHNDATTYTTIGTCCFKTSIIFYSHNTNC